jgi:RNA polymerase sigma factor (sigma-70 family)
MPSRVGRTDDDGGPVDEHSDDAAVVAALRAGDEDAFAQLLDREDAPLCPLARSFVSSAATADEVVQDTWLAVIEGIDRFERRSSLKTWIYRILMNKARTRGARDKRSVVFPGGRTRPGRRRAHVPGRPVPAAGPSHVAAALGNRATGLGEPAPAELEPHETLERVRAAIADLPTVHRLVITLRDLDECSSAEVCELLDLSPANQRVLLHRARAKVRDALEDYFAAVTP